MRTTRDINRDGINKIFISTTNSKGKTRVSIVRGTQARNYKEGELLYQEVFDSWRLVPESELAKINELTFLKTGKE